MSQFSITSLQRLNTCDIRLQAIFKEVIRHVNCTILCGHRGEEEQNKAFVEGKSKKQWPEGEHNKVPSKAVDAAPWPIDWEDRERFCLFAGIVLGISSQMAIKLIWGGDWDSDFNIKEHKFFDGPHFELVD